jgi:hypothetical protein
MPSAMLEQEAQMFGLRDSVFPVSGIGSPQHRQIREFMRSGESESLDWNRLTVNPPDRAEMELRTLSSPDTATSILEWRSPRIPSPEPAASASIYSKFANC